MPKGNVVKQFQNGKLQVNICDDYCRDKTPEEIREIIIKLERISYPSLVKIQRQKQIDN